MIFQARLASCLLVQGGGASFIFYGEVFGLLSCSPTDCMLLDVVVDVVALMGVQLLSKSTVQS